MEQLFVGIDVAKDRLDVHLRPSAKAFAISRDGKGLTELTERLQQLQPTLIVLEATGGFEVTVAAALAAANLPLAVVNPRQVRDFARATGRLAKTDALDAAVIAHFAEAIRPEPRPVPSEQATALAELVARRQIIDMTTAETNRRSRVSSRRILASIDRLVLTLHKELAELDADIDDQIRSSPVWREKEQLLTSAPGIATTTARQLLARMPELGTLDRHKIAALAGLAPMACDSGTSKGQRHIAGGRADVRAALYMAALSAARFNPPLKAFADRLRAKGLAKKAIIIAVARKLLVQLNAILRTNTPWQPKKA
jgi:transposase